MRLTNRAYDILLAELRKYVSTDPSLGTVQFQIVLKRLEKLRLKEGSLASVEELRDQIKDLFPQFDEQVLQQAAKANVPPGPLSKIRLAITTALGVAGFIWLVNLPYPMIRWPVAKSLPILLLPSFISMDYNYRQAIGLVEQADQLVNNATASADIELGEQKAKQAKKHLDALPVWFLGYYPQRYCSLFACGWAFTFDEFEKARKDIGRMEAIVFQEKNAHSLLLQGEAALASAQAQYKSATPGAQKQEAIKSWQKAIEKLETISPGTLAGKMVQTKLAATKQEFDDVVVSVADMQQSHTYIEAARQFAWQAAKASQNPPHPEEKWEEIIGLWEEAIERLKSVPDKNPGYLDAQKRLAEYQQNLGITKAKLQREKSAVVAMNIAKRSIAHWQEANQTDPNSAYLARQLQEIINQLEIIKPGTTVYAEAKELLGYARQARKKK